MLYMIDPLEEPNPEWDIFPHQPTKAMSETPIQNPICTCFTCGYQWRRGMNGSHECTTLLKSALTAAQAEVERLKGEIRGVIEYNIPEDCRIVSREGAGHEDVIASLSLSVSKLAARVTGTGKREIPKEFDLSRDSHQAIESLMCLAGVSCEPGWDFDNITYKLDLVRESLWNCYNRREAENAALKRELEESRAELVKEHSFRKAFEWDFRNMKGRFCEHHGTPGSVKPHCPECSRDQLQSRVVELESRLKNE
jgi:hypothetical protein